MGDGLGNKADDLVFTDDAKVIVGQERDRSAALAWPAIENDRARLGDAQGTGGQHTVALIELRHWPGQARGESTTPPGSQSGGRSAGTTSCFTPRRAHAAAMVRGRSAAHDFVSLWPCTHELAR